MSLEKSNDDFSLFKISAVKKRAFWKFFLAVTKYFKKLNKTAIEEKK